MATVIADAATELTLRLKTSGLAPDPTTAQLSDFIRRAFAHLVGVLPPVTETTFTLVAGDPDSTVDLTSVPTSRIFYVATGVDLLFPNEWQKIKNTVYVRRTAAPPGALVVLWNVPALTITLGSTLTVETSCVFGQNWLEELALNEAAITAYQTLMRTAGTNSGQEYDKRIALFKERYNELFGQLQKEYLDWKKEMDTRLALRLQTNDGPVVASPFHGWTNSSGVTNRATGQN